MSRIAFPTCEKSDTSDQEPRIMFHSSLVGAVSYTAQAIALPVWREQIVFIRISSIVNIEKKQKSSFNNLVEGLELPKLTYEEQIRLEHELSLEEIKKF